MPQWDAHHTVSTSQDLEIVQYDEVLPRSIVCTASRILNHIAALWIAEAYRVHIGFLCQMSPLEIPVLLSWNAVYTLPLWDWPDHKMSLLHTPLFL